MICHQSKEETQEISRDNKHAKKRRCMGDVQRFAPFPGIERTFILSTVHAQKILLWQVTRTQSPTVAFEGRRLHTVQCTVSYSMIILQDTPASRFAPLLQTIAGCQLCAFSAAVFSNLLLLFVPNLCVYPNTFNPRPTHLSLVLVLSVPTPFWRAFVYPFQSSSFATLAIERKLSTCAFQFSVSNFRPTFHLLIFTCGLCTEWLPVL